PPTSISTRVPGPVVVSSSLSSSRSPAPTPDPDPGPGPDTDPAGSLVPSDERTSPTFTPRWYTGASTGTRPACAGSVTVAVAPESNTPAPRPTSNAAASTATTENTTPRTMSVRRGVGPATRRLT